LSEKHGLNRAKKTDLYTGVTRKSKLKIVLVGKEKRGKEKPKVQYVDILIACM